jgi:hypothetical protein
MYIIQSSEPKYYEPFIKRTYIKKMSENYTFLHSNMIQSECHGMLQKINK